MCACAAILMDLAKTDPSGRLVFRQGPSLKKGEEILPAKGKFLIEQIVGALKQAEVRASMAELTLETTMLQNGLRKKF